MNVPNIVGQTAGDAEKALRAKELTLGQASPQPVDPKGKISSQIPAAGEVVKAGTPVNIFYPDPADAENKKKQKDKDKGKDGAAGAGAAGAGAGGGAAADIVVPAIDGAKLDAYAKKIADLGVVPVVSKQFNDAPPGTPFATVPPGGTKVATEVEGHAARLRRPAAGRLHQRQEHPAPQRRHRRQARPGRHQPGGRRGSDLDRRRRARRLHGRRPRDAQGPDQEELGRRPADQGRRDVREPRLGTDRRQEPARDERRLRQRRHRSLPRQHQERRDRRELPPRALVRGHPPPALGPGRALAARRRRQAPGGLGPVRHRALAREEGQAGVLARTRTTGTRAAS